MIPAATAHANPRDTPLLPEATARALGAKLRGRRLLNISRGASSAFDVLLEMFRPARLVNVDVDAAAHSRIVVPEPPSIFDAAFLFGLLPECITQDSNLLKEASRVLAGGGMLVASTRLHSRIAPRAWGPQKNSSSLALCRELARHELDLVEAYTAVTGVGLFLVVAQKRARPAEAAYES